MDVWPLAREKSCEYDHVDINMWHVACENDETVFYIFMFLYFYDDANFEDFPFS